MARPARALARREESLELLSDLGLIDDEYPEAAIALYEHVAVRGLFITNLASCTQPDARHLPDAVFRDYLPIMYDEILKANPRRIITFGNQVSSILFRADGFRLRLCRFGIRDA